MQFTLIRKERNEITAVFSIIFSRICPDKCEMQAPNCCWAHDIRKALNEHDPFRCD
jgi:hypothetical protein